MSEIRNTPQAPEDPSGWTENPPRDLARICEAVIELNIARKNAVIYPSEHIQVRRSTNRAFKSLTMLFDSRTEITLGVMRDGLVIGRFFLDRKNPVFREFAVSLHQHGIVVITFRKGLEARELDRFFRILSVKPEQIREFGGIGKSVADAEISHILAKEVDYSRFHVTGEEEILSPDKNDTQADKVSDLFMAFTADLMGSAVAGKKDSAMAGGEMADAGNLAQYLNEHRISADAALRSYEAIIGKHLRESAEKDPSAENISHTLRSLDTLLKDLHPRLKSRFHSATLRSLFPGGKPGSGEEALGTTGQEVIRILRQVSDSGGDLSPSLLPLMQRLLRTGDPSSIEPEGQGPGAKEGSAHPELSPEQLAVLFRREKYETYVETDYARMLEGMEGLGESGSSGREHGFALDEELESLKEESLDFQITRALIAFMDEEIQADAYGDFSGKVVSLVPRFLEAGEFSMLLEILEQLRRHSREKPSPELRETAEKSLSVFTNPQFIESSVAAFIRYAKTHRHEASDFLLALGPACIPGLLKRYFEGRRGGIPELLSDFGKEAAVPCMAYLKDSPDRRVRLAVKLIRRIGAPGAAPSLRALMTHPDPNVRMEVIAALLKLKDPWGTAFLRKALHSKDRKTIRKAVFLAGASRIPDLCQDLAKILRRVRFFKSDYRTAAKVIQAMGKIGNERAVPDLERLAQTRFDLHPAYLADLKQVLYRSLKGYPREAIAGLVATGLKSDDPGIVRWLHDLEEHKDAVD